MASMGKSKGEFFLRVLKTGEAKGEFRTRLAVEGRWNKFVAVREKLKSENGLSDAQAWQAASNQFHPLEEGQVDETSVDVLVALVRNELDAAKADEPTATVTT